MASNVLPLFWQLSSNDKKARLDASEELVSALQTFQKQHEAKQGSSSGKALDDDADMESDDDEEDEDEDGDESGVEVDEDDDMDAQPKRTREMDEEDAEMARLDRVFEAANSSDVQYSIKRLIRGLSSSRENSRFGFAVALTEVRTCRSCSSTAINSPDCDLAACDNRYDIAQTYDLAHRTRIPDIKRHEGHGREGQPVCEVIRSHCRR
jgi:hypothetical protein